MKPALSFDALTLHAVVDELRPRIVGAQVQKLVLVGPDALGLELYGRGRRTSLLISMAPTAARVSVTDERPARASEAVTPMLLLLRKHVRDGRVEAIDQPRLERVLELRVTKRDDADDLHQVRVIIEAMGRRSNTILVDEDGTILDAFRRASREKNPARPILPHVRYEPPPPQVRSSPFAADTWDHLQELAAKRPDGTLADLLAGELQGFSPILAREAAFRSAGSVATPVQAADWATVRASVGELLAPVRGTSPWSPSVARWQGQVVAFAAYRLRHLEASCAVEDVASISQAVELGYRQAAERPARGPAGQAIAPLLEAIDARRAVLARRIAALERARDAAGDPDALRTAGELILASLGSIRPGQDTLVVDGREIRLEPRETPIENAQRYFREYRRARDAGRRVPELIRQARLELTYLDDMWTLAELADDPSRVRALREELRSSGVMTDRAPRAVKKQRPTDDGARPLRLALPDGFVALIGTSARGNERVTFELADQEDVWLHARNLPGAHVIVRTGGRDLPQPVLVEAARLAAYFSRGRDAARVPVDWTLRKYVRKIRGGPAGLVSYVNERTLEVPPRAPTA